jgi:hypothetical protein
MQVLFLAISTILDTNLPDDVTLLRKNSKKVKKKIFKMVRLLKEIFIV